MKQIFSLSENASLEYCASIVRIGEMIEIESSDFLAKTYVNGFPIVVRKNEVKTGDVMIYCPIETVLNRRFLSKNNLFEISERKMNDNYAIVQSLIDSGQKEEAKKLVGFFNKHGRIKIITLKGEPSMGFLFNPEDLLKWDSSISIDGIEELVGTQFDTINGELFIKVYIPYIETDSANNNSSNRRLKKRQKSIKKFNRMKEGEFFFHYDTNMLGANMWRIKPDDTVFIDLKFHGTSFICGNIITKFPIYLNPLKKAIRRRLFHDVKKLNKNINETYDNKSLKKYRNLLISKIPKSYVEKYGNVYASRSVIKNQYINKGVTSGFYGYDIWGEVNNILFPYIPEGMTVYGEIIGYVPKNNKLVQKGYDYGCEERTFKFLIYRITTKNGNKVKEWNKSDVDKWTKKLVEQNPSLKKYIQFLVVFYHGKLKDLYPDISINEHWHENVLQRMENDKERFGLEMDEPLCINKVPREGIVVRIDDDDKPEAFKLKSIAFCMREKKFIDKGEIDTEILENRKYFK